MSEELKKQEPLSKVVFESNKSELNESINEMRELIKDKIGDHATTESIFTIWICPKNISDFTKQLSDTNFNLWRLFISRINLQVYEILERSESLVNNEDYPIQGFTPYSGIAEDFYRVGCHLRHAFNTISQEVNKAEDQALAK